MPTIQQQINQLKKDKETLNTMLNTMGVETTGNETFTELTPLVGKIVTDPILQDKTITITENGTYNIIPDEGYDGLNSINVVIDVAGETQVDDYISDGMVAWFDGEDTMDENGHWNSRIGSDYIYTYSQTEGDYTTNPITNNGLGYVNNKNYALVTNKEYYNLNYTIEVVGKINGQVNSDSSTSGGWLFSTNEMGAWGVSVSGDTGKIVFSNNKEHTVEKNFEGYYGKAFTGAIYFEHYVNKGSDGRGTNRASVNGCEWFAVTETADGYGTNYVNDAILCYYTGNAKQYRADGEIYCIRVYNRKLSNDELTHNHAIDKIRFNLSE